MVNYSIKADLSNEDVRSTLLTLARQRYKTRESLESYVRVIVESQIDGRVKDFAEWQNVAHVLEGDKVRDKNYVEEVLNGRRQLTFDFVNDAALCFGKTTAEFFPFDDKLPLDMYTRTYESLSGERINPEEAKARLHLMFYIRVLPEE